MDCFHVLAELSKVDSLITDPPYGVGLTKRVTKNTTRTASTLYRDDPEFVKTVIIPRVKLAISRVSCAAITPGSRMLFHYPEPVEVGCMFFPNGTGRSRWGFNCHNPILYYGKDPYLAKGLGSRPNSMARTYCKTEKIDHPCPKPLVWIQWMVKRASLPDQTVIDPFMGSGTTGVACIQLGRKFIGIELEPKYFRISVKRIRKAINLKKMEFVSKPKILPREGFF